MQIIRDRKYLIGDKHLAKLLKQDDKKDFVSRENVFEVLESVK